MFTPTLKAEGTPKLIVGPGDHGEPVIMILLPDEDRPSRITGTFAWSLG